MLRGPLRKELEKMTAETFYGRVYPLLNQFTPVILPYLSKRFLNSFGLRLTSADFRRSPKTGDLQLILGSDEIDYEPLISAALPFIREKAQGRIANMPGILGVIMPALLSLPDENRKEMLRQIPDDTKAKLIR